MLVFVLVVPSILLRLTPTLHRFLPWAVLILTSVVAAHPVQVWAEHWGGLLATDMALPRSADAPAAPVTISVIGASPTVPAVTCWTTQPRTTDVILVHGNDEMNELYHELHCQD